MKIRIVNPDYGVGEEAMARRCKFLQRYVGPDVELSMVCLTQTRVEIDSASDVVLAGRKSCTWPTRQSRRAVRLWCCTASPILYWKPAGSS